MVAISIKAADRVFVCGVTGMGKSTLVATQLLPPVQRFVVLDPKGEFDFPDVKITDKVHPKLDRQIVRFARINSRTKYERWGAAIDAAHAMRNVVIYVDELTEVSPRTYPTDALDYALRSGRSKNVALWAGTQTPTGIPTLMYSMAQHFFCFHMNNRAHRKKMGEVTYEGIAPIIESLKEYEFVYYTTRGRKTIEQRIRKD